MNNKEHEVYRSLEKAFAYETLTASQLLRLIWWSAFKRRKFSKLMKYLNDGMLAKYAYERVIKETNKLAEEHLNTKQQ